MPAPGKQSRIGNANAPTGGLGIEVKFQMASGAKLLEKSREYLVGGWLTGQSGRWMQLCEMSLECWSNDSVFFPASYHFFLHFFLSLQEKCFYHNRESLLLIITVKHRTLDDPLPYASSSVIIYFFLVYCVSYNSNPTSNTILIICTNKTFFPKYSLLYQNYKVICFYPKSFQIFLLLWWMYAFCKIYIELDETYLLLLIYNNILFFKIFFSNL